MICEWSSLDTHARPRPARGQQRLGERLVECGIISERQLEEALEVQRRSTGFLGQTLVDLGFVSAPVMGGLLSADFGVPYVDLLSIIPDREAVRLLPESSLRSGRMLPVRLRGEALEVAMVDPLDTAAIDEIHLATGKRVTPLLTMAWELKRAIQDYSDSPSGGSRRPASLRESPSASLPRVSEPADDTAVVDLVASLIERGLGLGASDIHFDPDERGVRVRYRVDGRLTEHAVVSQSQRAAVIARLKVLSEMDITESRRPQDGRIRYECGGRCYDLRVSSILSVFGEKLVLRILDKSSIMVPLSRLGLRTEQQRTLEHLIRQPHGMVLVVGPTGSGKTTTLYSALNLLMDGSRNIMTLEDPVEYNVPGLCQVQVNPRIGLTFAAGLRTMLRQDPDVMLVGEIRDPETAETAVQASLTGHLVLSTLHTNSAVGAISRLTNLGVDPFLISQALSGVISQRLLARVCPHCAVSYRPSDEVLEAVGIRPEELVGARLKRGAGCRICYGRGYQGRVGVYEMLTLDDEVRRRVIKGASEAEIMSAALGSGMRSFRDAVLAAVCEGMTTPEEMARVVLARER